MRLRYGSRRHIGALLAGFALVAGPASPQFTPFAHDAATILEGIGSRVEKLTAASPSPSTTTS
jgi:hypothetical protein